MGGDDIRGARVTLVGTETWRYDQRTTDSDGHSRLAEAGAFGGEERSYVFEGAMDDRQLPTIRTPHGRADAAFHVVVATAWARDPHLVRDVAICSTTEL